MIHPWTNRPGPGFRVLLAVLTAIAFALLQPAHAADALAYDVTLRPTGDDALDSVLRDSSGLIALRDASRPDPFGLVLRARQDIDRLETASRSFGYYRARVAILIAGQPLDTPDLTDRLAAAAAQPPVPVIIQVDRGQQFRIGAVRLDGDVPPAIAGRLTLVPGAPATASSILAAQAQMLSLLRDSGHALARVDLPPAVLRPSDGLLDVTLRVVPGPVVAIGVTKPKAIRVVLPPSQEARLGRLARERRTTKEKALEAIIGEALGGPARTGRRRRAASA